MSDNQLKISGTVLKVEDAVQVTEKLTKRNLVLSTGDKYPETVAIEFINDKADLLDAIAPGQILDVSFNLRGREYNGRYYINLAGWKVEVSGGATQPTAAPKSDFASANKNPALRAQPAPIASVDDDSLPF